MYPPAATTNASQMGARPETIASVPGARRATTIATANTPARSRDHGPSASVTTAQAAAANVMPSHRRARPVAREVRPPRIAATLPAALAISTAVANAAATSDPGPWVTNESFPSPRQSARCAATDRTAWRAEITARTLRSRAVTFATLAATLRRMPPWSIAAAIVFTAKFLVLAALV